MAGENEVRTSDTDLLSHNNIHIPSLTNPQTRAETDAFGEIQVRGPLGV